MVDLICYVCEYTVLTTETKNSVSWENAKNGNIRNKWRYKSIISSFRCLIKFVTDYLAYEQLTDTDLGQAEKVMT